MIVRPSPTEQFPELAQDLRPEKRWTTYHRRLSSPQRSSGGRTRVCRGRHYCRRFPFTQTPPLGALQVPVFSNKLPNKLVWKLRAGSCYRGKH